MKLPRSIWGQDLVRALRVLGYEVIPLPVRYRIIPILQAVANNALCEFIIVRLQTANGISRQKGSHIRVTTRLNGQNHETIPNHSPIKPGLLSGILKRTAAHHRLTTDELLTRLDL